MKTKPKKIYIANDSHLKGGTIVLSALCANLRELGYDARLIVRVFKCHGEPMGRVSLSARIKRMILFSLLRFSLIPKKYLGRFQSSVTIPGMADNLKLKLRTPSDKKNAVMIYPEIIWGNPLGMENVVRWLLYHHRYYEGKDTYSPDDCFIAYRSVFNDEKLNPEKTILHLNYFDSDLYRNYNPGPREGNCYILRKGRNRKDLPAEFDGPVFDDNMSDEEFVKILNRCKYCYIYDTQTFYGAIAAVCGCIPVVILEPGKTVSDYLSADEKHYGVAYGNTPEQIEYALSTRDLLFKKLDYKESNRENTKKFVEYLESKFGELKRI